MNSSGETPGGDGIEVASRQICRMVLYETVRSQSTLYNIFFRPLPRAPNCAAHDVKWTFRHGRTTSCTRIQYSRYIYILLSWIFRIVYINTFGHNECVVGINGTARFIILFALTPNQTHGVPYIIFFPNTISSFIICRPFPLNFILLFFTYPNSYII